MTTRTLATTLATCSLLGALAAPAAADAVGFEAPTAVPSIERSVPRAPRDRKHVRMTLELGTILAVGNRWYWRDNGKPNEIDWQLPADDAVGLKLGHLDAWRFDGNPFDINALGHPGFGMLTHFLARENGYRLAESFLISTVASGAWEVFLELREYGSLNDMLMTSTAGVPLGEAAYQLVHHAREARYEVATGVGVENGAPFATAGARAELDRVPRTGEGTFAAGRHVSLEAGVATDEQLVRSVAGRATAMLGGWYRNTADRTLRLGVMSAFDYRNDQDRQERAWDLQSTVGIGPRLDIAVRHGDLTLAVDASARFEVGMSRAAAFDGWRAQHPMARVRHVMQDKERPYYYGAGASVDPGIEARVGGFNVGARVTARVLRSLDGADRDQEMLTSDAQMRDHDVRARTWIGYSRGAATATVGGSIAQRGGSMGDVDAGYAGRIAMLTMAYRR